VGCCLAGRLHGKGAAILMYHSVLEDPGSVADSLGGMIHPRAIFEGQMELLAWEFHPVSLNQVGRFVRGEGWPCRSSIAWECRQPFT
jgi:hypothetical protein